MQNQVTTMPTATAAPAVQAAGDATANIATMILQAAANPQTNVANIAKMYDLYKAEAERLADQAKQDEKALARANERLTRLGKPTVKSLDELPTDFEAPDEYQIEAANITADLARLSKG